CRSLLASLFVALSMLLVAGASQAQGFNAVYSQDGIDVWAVGDLGAVYRSFDGGADWTSTGLGTRGLRAVAAHGFGGVVVGDSGKVWRSPDSGGTWSLSVIAGAPALRGLSMPTGQTGYVVGDGGMILKTIDGGATWTPQASGTGVNLNAVGFTDARMGFAVRDNAPVPRTANGGGARAPIAVNATTPHRPAHVLG